MHGRHFIFVVLRCKTGQMPPESCRRLGVTVTKRVAGAVGRNRVKRLVRSVFRQERTLFPENCEVVVVAKRGAELLGYAQVRDDVALVQYRLRKVAGLRGGAHSAGDRT